MSTKKSLIAIVLNVCIILSVQADNPLVPDVGMADPHVHIFNDKAYMYTTRDAKPATPDWNMPDWNVWSSDNLIDWTHETTVYPADTYIGESIYCWAPDAATANGKYYFYLSNQLIDTAVVVSDSPAGPFVDALGEPLLPEDLTTTHEYDICVLFDQGTPYIIFGTHSPTDPNKKYHIAALNPDMISLAETPQKITVNNSTGFNFYGDKPNIHIHNGTYYLTTGAHYAMADNIHGPYEVIWAEGDDLHPFAMSRRAHGNFFEWNRQWFYVWTRFEIAHDIAKYRECQMTYVHYKDNGEMVYDEELLELDYSNGVGQYRAAWPVIQAEWFMGMPDGPEKKEHPVSGFEIRNLTDGTYLHYPNIHNFPVNPEVSLHYSCASAGGSVTVRDGGDTGPILGMADFSSTGSWESYSDISIPLTAGALDESRSLTFVFSGVDSNELIRVDYFSVGGGKPVGTGIHDNEDAAIVYAGNWNTQDATSDYNNSMSYSDGTDDAATLWFEGRRVKAAVRKGPAGGVVDVYLDGTLVAQDVDTYSPSEEYQQIIYDSGTIAAGIHTIKLVATGQKNDASSASTIMLDYFTVLDAYVDLEVRATEHDEESHPADDDIIRKIAPKIGFIQNESWVRYNDFDFEAGAVSIEIMAGSDGVDGSVEVRLGSPTGILIGTVPVDDTGNMDAFEPFSSGLASVTGIHDLFFVFKGDAGYLFNMNAFTVKTGHKLDTPIEAASFNEESHPDDDMLIRNVGYKVGFIQDGTWVRYSNVDCASGADRIECLVASDLSGGFIEIHTGSQTGPLLGTVTVPNTGGWTQYQTVSADLSVVSGIQDLFLVFSGDAGYLFDMKSFVIQAVKTEPVAHSVLNGGLGTIVDADGNGVEWVTLEGSESTPAYGFVLTDYRWARGAQAIASGISTNVLLPLGTHEITLHVTDSNGGVAEDTALITVTPPFVMTGATNIVAGWDTWNSTTVPDASVLAANVTGTAITTAEQNSWNITDERGASADGDWGTFTGPPTASTEVVDGENLTLPNATSGGTIIFTVTNKGGADIELIAFHIDAYAFRNKAPRAYELSVLVGSDITVGTIYTSADDEITHVNGSNSNLAHDDIDHALTGLADHTLGAGESVDFLLAFSSGGGDGSGGHHLFVDNVAISGLAEGDELEYPDDDGNDLPDWWETLYLGGIGQDALVDSDLDGFSNGDELIAGTDPGLASSVFQINALRNESGGGYTLTWDSYSHRTYYAVKAPVLISNTWETVSDPMPGTGGEMTFKDDSAISPSNAFYKIQVMKP